MNDYIYRKRIGILHSSSAAAELLVLLVCFTVAGNQFKMEWDVSRLKESLSLWIHNLNDDMSSIRKNIPRNSA
jgi:hypothetical protein